MRLLASSVLVLACAGTASADPTPTYDIGFRVGGYGFKREGDDRPGTGWTECRMNGVGVFASRALTGPLFAEAGLDMYTSASFPLPPDSMDLPIDRMSGLVSVAGGARTQLASWARGYIQLGAGMEVTRVAVPYHETSIRDTKVMPEGFLGVGLDLKVGARTYVGASFRTLMMGNFNYSRAELDSTVWSSSSPPAADVFDPSLDFAAQGQFYLRRDL